MSTVCDTRERIQGMVPHNESTKFIMHTHILDTSLVRYTVITHLDEWDWEDFFSKVIPSGTCSKVIKLIKNEKGRDTVTEYEPS